MAKQPKWQKQLSQCPQCKIALVRKIKALRSHFRSEHGLAPTHGEELQFKNFKNSDTPYSDKDFIKPKCEVSGGGCSPK